jgi:hypothetical protein
VEKVLRAGDEREALWLQGLPSNSWELDESWRGNRMAQHWQAKPGFHRGV